MDADRIDNLIAYALATAGNQDYPRPELGQIHLIKYLYLADMAYAERHGGQTYTGLAWKFHHFGPWSVDAWSRINPVVTKLGARTRNISTARGDEFIRYSLLGDPAKIISTLDSTLPWEVSRSIQNAVRKYGEDTKTLLHYVYSTPPMLNAAPGDILSFPFSSARAVSQTSHDSVIQAQELTRKQEKKQEATIADLKSRIQASLAHKKSSRPSTAEYYEPRYDDTFAHGQQWLDEMACGQYSPSEGTLIVDDSLWKSASRHDPDLS